MIHPTAIIDPKAELDSTVEVGPYAVIEAGVVVGPNCRIGPHVHLLGLTTMGEGNIIHAGAVVGDDSQDLKYRGQPTRLRIGDHNVIREHATLNRSSEEDEDTVIGSHCLLMANSHVGHNCRVGDYVRLANGSLLAGHVTVHDQAIVSGNCLVHQFVRVGKMSMMQGGTKISKDLPPFMMALDTNSVCGLNTIGLRRAGFNEEERLELKKLYRVLFREGNTVKDAVALAKEQFHSTPARYLIEFVDTTERGICYDVSRSRRGNPDEEPTED